MPDSQKVAFVTLWPSNEFQKGCRSAVSNKNSKSIR